MILQPLLTVSVSDVAIYSSGTSIGPSLTWQEARSQIAPLSAQVWQNLVHEKVSLYVNKEILGSRLSSRGSPPYSWPIGNGVGLRGDTGCLD